MEENRSDKSNFFYASLIKDISGKTITVIKHEPNLEVTQKHTNWIGKSYTIINDTDET